MIIVFFRNKDDFKIFMALLELMPHNKYDSDFFFKNKWFLFTGSKTKVSPLNILRS